MKPKQNSVTEHERNLCHNYEKIIQNLMEKIDILQSKLKSYGSEKIKLVTSYQQLEDENALLKLELDKHSKNSEELDKNKYSYIDKINSLTAQNKSTIDTYKTKFDIIARELQQKEYEIKSLKDDIIKKNEQIKLISVSSSIFSQFSDSTRDELDQERINSKNQKMRITELEKEIDKLYIQKKDEGNLLLENEQLKEDNIRLLNMLKNTEEFKDFGYLNSTLPGGIRYVKDAPKMKTRIKRQTKEELAKKDIDNWVPKEAFNIVLYYKNEYNLDINDKLINDMLSSLNKLWKDRETNNLTRTKLKYQREIINLKKKYGIPAYDTSDNLINFDNSGFKKSKTIANSEADQEKIDSLTHKLLMNTKKAANKCNNNEKELKKQINSLKKQINVNNMVSQKIDKDKFIMEKNATVIEKVAAEFNHMEIYFEDLYKEYYERVKDTETMITPNSNPLFNIKMINNSVKWLFSAFKDAINETKKKLDLWKKEYSQVTV